MRNPLSFVLTLVFLLTFSVFGHTDNSREIVELKEKGSINWSRGVVQAKGIGIPPLKFSGLMLRVSASDIIGRFPRCMLNPLKPAIMTSSLI